jgi:hypothetical protein
MSLLHITTPDQFFPYGREHSSRLTTSRHGRCFFPVVCGKPRRKVPGPSGAVPAPPKNKFAPWNEKSRALQRWAWPTGKREGEKIMARTGSALRRAMKKSARSYPFNSQTPPHTLPLLSIDGGGASQGRMPPPPVPGT